MDELEISVHPLTPDRWPDFEAVFQAKGCSIARGCWCMYYLESGKQEYPADVTPSEARKALMKARVSAGPPPGLIAYHEGEPVGWVALAPRAAYPRLHRSPVMKPVDEDPVWSVVCFVVPSAWRGRGIASALLHEAAIYAKTQGATILEGYPIDKAERGSSDWLWNGTKAMFDKVGFVEVARRRPQRPVVRLRLAEDNEEA
jgi:GNAT superfamily N-acetyltransferase